MDFLGSSFTMVPYRDGIRERERLGWGRECLTLTEAPAMEISHKMDAREMRIEIER